MKKHTTIKYFFAKSLSLCLLLSLTACGSSNVPDDTIQTTNLSEEIQSETFSTSQSEETSVAVEESTTSQTEETTEEKSNVEMVPFETWAAQEDNDEVCLVIWNETLGVQEILPTVSVSRQVYEVQEGDRLAIPYRESITSFGLRDKHTWMWYESPYYEISLPSGTISIIDIVSHDEETGETEVLTYSIKTKEVEMDTFETWATQPGNDDAYLVVWNEQLGVQDVLLPYEETQTAYKISDGDRFAVPVKPHIDKVYYSDNNAVVIGESPAKYTEIQVTAGDTITITYINDAHEKTTINYIFE